MSVSVCLSASVQHKLQVDVRSSQNRFFSCKSIFCLQCFDAVGWAAGRASGL